MLAVEQWYHQDTKKLGASTGAKTTDATLARGNRYHRNVYTRLREKVPLILPGYSVLIEPWFRNFNWKERSPDAVALNRETRHALVIEVKLNWKDGRDVKLIDEYLPIVRSAFELESVSPVLITADLRGYKHPPLLGLPQLPLALDWAPPAPTPLLLVPHGPA